MAMPSSGNPISASQINAELVRTAGTAMSITSAATGGYATINTGSSSYPNSSTPHSYSEWYSYNHSATPPSLSSYGLNTCFTPGDGGGEINFYFTIANAQGGEYVTLEGNVTAGDPITTTGTFGPSSGYTALGASAEANLTLKLYSSGNTLLATYTNFHTGLLPV
jgi:hypothetical protein